MRHIKKIVVVIFLLGTLQAKASSLVEDSTHVKDHVPPGEVSTSSSDVRTFDQLFIPASTLNHDPIIIPDQVFADSTAYYRSKAFEYQQEVTRRNALIGNLNDLSLLDLPVGLSRPGADLNYTVIISQVRFNPQGAFLEAYFIFELPQSGDKIAFRGTNIKFSYEGGLIGDGRMELIGSYPLKLNDKTLLTIQGKGNTYVEFDCDGFKGMGLESEIEFSRDLIIPEDEKGNHLPAPARVKTSFALYAQSWNDIMVNVNLPPFQVYGLKGVGFSVQQAFLDWSSVANPPGLMFPQNYPSPYIQAGEPKLWQGFYLQRLNVRLPPSFAQKKSNERVTVGVENMVLDDQGFSGTMFAENLIEAGDMNGWGYTLDRVGLELVTNQVKGFDLAGKLSVPVIKNKEGKATAFGYQAQRSADGNYIFAVKVESEVKLPLFVADMKLYQGSTVLVTERENKFYPSALLNGELSVKAPKAILNSIRFEQMVISSEAPHFKPGTFGFGRDGQSSSASNYPLVISNILVKSQGERVGLGFDVTINIGGKPEEEGFGGTAALTVWGKRDIQPVKDAEGQVTGTDQGDWKFDKIELSGVGIKIKKPGVIDIAGMVNFFEDDPTYGDGFKGSLKGKIQMIGVQADVLFGKTPAFRYWYADALVEIKNGIPLVPGFSAYGFGGGYYSKMKQSTQTVSTLGRTQSGVSYVPDENSIGIKALVMLGTAGRPEAFNGDAALEVMLNRHGGINSVTFKGNARFMAAMGNDLTSKIKENLPTAIQGKALTKLMEMAQGQVYGSVLLQFDNVNDIFHGNIEIFVNVAGGLVRGVSDGNKAGWATIHFSKEEWYILIGTPDQPIGLEVARIFKSRSYFMMGDNLPGSPPPPSQVSEILGNIDLDYMRDFNALESGTGFAFGLHFGVDTGDLRFLMFYGRFSAGTGVDFMLKNYGDNYHCKGSSGPIGIGGWYANGQAYAFVQGKIGIKVNLRFYKGNFDILSIGAAAILQAKGPNPFWMKGTVGGYYRILGGLVKGNCKFEVTVGDECKIVGNGSPLENVNIIAEVSPAKGETEVDVFNAPQAAFNIPIGEVFELTDFDDRKHFYRGHLTSFTVLDGTSPVEGNIRWNDDQDVAAFDSRDVLPPKKQLKAVVKVTFEERLMGEWKAVIYDGKPAEETMETTFTTGEAPDNIPPSNVAYAYPTPGQYNFYTGEYNKGFIKLKKGQPYLFKPGPEWIQKIHMTDATSQSYLETDVAYNEADKQVNFSIPSGFQKAKGYRFEILNFPKQQAVIDANVQKVETNISTDPEAGEAVLTTKQIEGDLALRDVKAIYTSHFRTSKYTTFLEKMRAMTVSQALSGNPGNNVLILGAYWRGDEYFDGFEIGETVNQVESRFINVEADLRGNPWFEQKMHPLVYDGYPLAGVMRIRNRNPEILGFPPVRDVYIAQDKNDLYVSSSGEVPNALAYFSGSRLEYQVTQSMFRDYYDLQNQVANYVINHSTNSPRFNLLLLSPYPIIDYGTYKVKLSYRIPGINVTTSSYDAVLLYSGNPGSN